MAGRVGGRRRCVSIRRIADRDTQECRCARRVGILKVLISLVVAREVPVRRFEYLIKSSFQLMAQIGTVAGALDLRAGSRGDAAPHRVAAEPSPDNRPLTTRGRQRSGSGRGAGHARTGDAASAGGPLAVFDLADEHRAIHQVAFASVNPTDLHRAGHAPPGTVLGYDAAGTVARAAADRYAVSCVQGELS